MNTLAHFFDFQRLTCKMLTKQQCEDITEYCTAVLNLLTYLRAYMYVRASSLRSLEKIGNDFREAEARYFATFGSLPGIHCYINSLNQQVLGLISGMDIPLSSKPVLVYVKVAGELASDIEVKRAQRILGEASKEVAFLSFDWQLLLRG